MCMFDGADCSTQFYSANTRKARKPHKCEECRRTIEPGELYQHVSAKWEGDLDTVKTCSHCVVAQKWLQKECGGFLHHAVLDDLEEHVREYGVSHYGFGLARMVVLSQNGWRRRGQIVPIPVVPPTTHDKAQP
jgi:hypothetical protein